MSDEKRQDIPPIPPNIKDMLTPDQLLSLRRIEGFGWDLRFVRRHKTPKPVIVVSNPDGKTLGVLEDDGRLNMEHSLRIR